MMDRRDEGEKAWDRVKALQQSRLPGWCGNEFEPSRLSNNQSDDFYWRATNQMSTKIVRCSHFLQHLRMNNSPLFVFALLHVNGNPNLWQVYVNKQENASLLIVN